MLGRVCCAFLDLATIAVYPLAAGYFYVRETPTKFAIYTLVPHNNCLNIYLAVSYGPSGLPLPPSHTQTPGERAAENLEVEV